MGNKLTVEILPQPDDFTCGPTCLHAIYRYYGDELELEQVISEVSQVEGGGTLAVLLAGHALRRGYRATIYSYNVQVFDPTWFHLDRTEMADRLRKQSEAKRRPKLQAATEAYLEFLKLGGRLRFKDLTPSLIRHYLRRKIPILTGLSATYLHRTAREFGPACDTDAIRGEPTGHFVILCGYEPRARRIVIADPLLPTPFSQTHFYAASVFRIINSILLGIVTYDANLLIIEPPDHHPTTRTHHDVADRRQ